jgi:uncharacterized protein
MIALFNRSDAHHKTALAFLKRCDDIQMISTSLAIGEVAAYLSGQQHRLFDFLEWVETTVLVDDQFNEDLPRIIEVMKKYRDLPADLADVSLIALCERRGITEVASIDKDFQVYRLQKGRRFENVFFSTKGA